MANKVVVIPGDGIGPEILAATQKVLEAAGASLQWEEHAAGESAIKQFGSPLPPETLKAIQKIGVALKGPLATPIGGGYKSINVELRQRLDLFANLRPAKNIPGVSSRYEGVDVVVVRENTEGLYSGIEHYVTPKLDIVESIAVISRAASERVIRYAFEYAKQHGREKITLVHKANILKLSGGLFLNVGREIAAEFPEILFEERIIDAVCMQLVTRPLDFDMIVTTNLFGDILSDLTAGLVGGLGLAPAANIGTGIAIFEAVHGTAPDLVGSKRANPTALILAGIMMLRYLGQEKAAARVEQALTSVLQKKECCTPDIGGKATTDEFIAALIKEI